MSALLNEIGRHLGESTVQRLADQVGAEEPDVRHAAEVALPLLIGALDHTAEADPRALHEALERDHDGSVLDELDTLLGRAAKGERPTDTGTMTEGDVAADRRALDGPGILDHLLGDRREPVEVGISRASKLQVEYVRKLLSLLAIVVMEALGRLQRELELDVDDLRALLQAEGEEVQEQLAERDTRLLHFLDEDTEGDVMGNVAEVGERLRGKGLLEALISKPAT